MRVKHIGIRSAVGVRKGNVRMNKAELVLDYSESVVSVEHASPFADLPPHRPSAGGIAAADKRLMNPLEKGRILIGGNLVAGVSAPKMGEMAVGG